MIYYLVAAAIAAIVLIVWRTKRTDQKEKKDGPGAPEWFFTPGYKKAGIRGETAAANAIETILLPGDNLFTNVSIEYDDKPAELDIVIVNQYGVFIFEVKNYNGVLVGGENDYEWTKYKTTRAGNVYERTVKNPIKQVKRQSYVLSHYLDYYGLRTWIKGYAILLQGNSPVESEYILTRLDEVDRVIHTVDRQVLGPQKVESIADLLK